MGNLHASLMASKRPTDMPAWSIEHLLAACEEANEKSLNLPDREGNHFVFVPMGPAVRSKTAWHPLWQFSTRVRCELVGSDGEELALQRVYTVKGFYRIYALLQEFSPDSPIPSSAEVITRLVHRYLAFLPGGLRVLSHGYGLPTRDRLDQHATVPDECFICFDGRADHVLPCAHAFCRNCLNEWREQSVHATCPVCRADIRESANDYEMVEPPNPNDVTEYLEDSHYSSTPQRQQWWSSLWSLLFSQRR